MTQQELRNKVVQTALSWLDCRESDGSHKKIVDIYNSHSPLARGYRLKYTDAWCAGMVSAVAIACGLTQIMPTEVGCGPMIALYQKQGRWQEADAYIPRPGDVIFYDWDDTGSGDNKGAPEHVGIVEKVSGSEISVVEGNYDNRVKRRRLSVNGRYIRGYGLPDYGAVAEVPQCRELPLLEAGAENTVVKAMQLLLTGYGYSCGTWGADGAFGTDTREALQAYQKARQLEADGICGPVTWASLLGL